MLQEQPPKDEDVEVDGVEVLELAKGVRVLRGICSKRLKFDIEFSRKRGTTDNCYLVKVSANIQSCIASWKACTWKSEQNAFIGYIKNLACKSASCARDWKWQKEGNVMYGDTLVAWQSLSLKNNLVAG